VTNLPEISSPETFLSETVVALVPAAGASLRMAGDTPKLLCKIAGKTILERTLQTLSSVPEVDRIIVITREDIRQKVSAVVSLVANKAIDVTIGGDTRQASVRLGLEQLTELSPNAIVIIHDAARCFASPELIARAVSAAQKHGAVTTAVRIFDSLKKVSLHMRVESSLDRHGVWAVQTPQAFRYKLLKQAHEVDSNDATDDASLVEKIHPVHVVEGEKLNFKITTPEDLEIAEKLCNGKT